MRIAWAMAVVAAASGTQAMAAEPAASIIDAPLLGRAPAVVAPMVEARMGADKGRRFDTHVVLVSDQFSADGAPLKHRFASSMMEFYPLAKSGFHLSGGMRFFGVTNFAREAEKLTNNLLWSPTQRGLSGMRTGFKRQTPAMTFGYTQTFANKIAFGLEAGTLLGRVNASMPRAFGRGLGSVGDDHRVNPVANLVLGMKF